MTDEQLNHWGDVFEQRGIASYMTFAQFIADPHAALQRIEDGDYRPLLAAQRDVQRRIDAEHLQEELTPTQARLRDQALVEPLHHNAFDTSRTVHHNRQEH